MENYEKELLKKLKEKHQSYASMIEFCCDSLIMNNSIQSELEQKGFCFDYYCGQDYHEDEAGEIYYEDIYQQFIIGERDAERLEEYTNELVLYCEELDLYLLCVTHLGTSWEYISANWKDIEEGKNDK